MRNTTKKTNGSKLLGLDPQSDSNQKHFHTTKNQQHKIKTNNNKKQESKKIFSSQ